ncbi:high frequency lysogenization protein HflD [Sedimenticola selenatireducens]|uniref:High frequency lysogenization protein HflD homolog n=1 Tax=Sedimenticola selenatireducens TaxID=191960 RepID=A0A558DRB5_9GAMM|nr:high frequency lysogenization protein HflD [Sedimenticola selenatireducens]TVO73552.1 high frequency lysogenization protein HflD [Sedimenticola selenatireducens]TVT63493.1 MAG: high frequency lysogenization protein HflD [Sedimenticola selenatireducens]
MKSNKDRCIALAGVFQAASMAAQIAESGTAESENMEASIRSLFKINADSVEDVYGGLRGVELGLRLIQRQLGEKQTDNVMVTQYVIALLHLEGKLRKNPAMLEQIKEGIQLADRRMDHFPLLHANIIAQLADIYSNSISTLKPRIMVQGDPLHLQNPDNVNRIRALLLSGIRSAILWRQCGGGRFQVIFNRKKLAEEARRLLHVL